MDERLGSTLEECFNFLELVVRIPILIDFARILYIYLRLVAMGLLVV